MSPGDAQTVVPPNPEFPTAPITGTTELRTHGVSGTPVESMLHHPHPVRVAGAGAAGFFRRGDDHAVQFDPVPEGRNLEAYSWGGLTSGNASRAFWLLLVPFTLANVASWVHPVRPRTRFAPIGLMSGLIRLFALSLTVTFMLATATVGIDLIAWQCVNAEKDCAQDHFFTDFMTKGAWNQPGMRIALGALLPLVVLVVLFLLSRSTSRAYEKFADSDSAVVPPTNDSSGAADFANPRFWQGGEPLQRLRSLHVCTALATVAGVVAYAAGHGSTDRVQWIGDALPYVASSLAAAAAVLMLSPWTGRRGPLLKGQEPPRFIRFIMRHAQWAGLALLVIALTYAAWPAIPSPEPDTVPGLGSVIAVVFVTQVGLLVLYFLAAAWAKLRSPGTDQRTLVKHTLFRSFGAPVLATLALGFAGMYATGLVLRVADYLGDPCQRGCDAANDVTVQSTYFVAAPLAAWAVTAALVLGLATWLWLRHRANCLEAVVRHEYDQGETGKRVKAIAKAQASASLTDRADVLVSLFLLCTIAPPLLVWWRSDTRSLPGGLKEDNRWQDLLTGTSTAGTWLVGVILIGLVFLGRSAYSSDRSRRTVGILWDLGTFWPRATHPFAPPCYCERVVPELTSRVDRMTEAGGTVVISAHSQGSIIAAAVVHRLLPDRCKRVALVTYGSPLERLYARLFPHFFGSRELEDLHRKLAGCWRNLHRRTDPIGGPVFTLDAAAWTCCPQVPTSTPSTVPPELRDVDVPLVDPEFAMPLGEFEDVAPRGHSDYFHDARFAATITSMAGCVQAKWPPTENPTQTGSVDGVGGGT